MSAVTFQEYFDLNEHQYNALVLRNNNEASVDVSGLSVCWAAQCVVFPSGTVMAGGGMLTLADDNNLDAPPNTLPYGVGANTFFQADHTGGYAAFYAFDATQMGLTAEQFESNTCDFVQWGTEDFTPYDVYYSTHKLWDKNTPTATVPALLSPFGEYSRTTPFENASTAWSTFTGG